MVETSPDLKTARQPDTCRRPVLSQVFVVIDSIAFFEGVTGSLSNMLKWLVIIVQALSSAMCTQRNLAVENLVLRQQLAVLKERKPRTQLTDADRLF